MKKALIIIGIAFALLGGFNVRANPLAIERLCSVMGEVASDSWKLRTFDGMTEAQHEARIEQIVLTNDPMLRKLATRSMRIGFNAEVYGDARLEAVEFCTKLMENYQ